MSILIRGMEMPTCFSCQLESYCGRWAKHDKEWQKGNRDDDCQLVEVPTPHGRLIDVDDIENITVIMNENGIGFNRIIAPTVIEAEGINNQRQQQYLQDICKRLAQLLREEEEVER